MSVEKIALVGFMGSGKTTVGKVLADQLSRPFVDLDEYLVVKVGRPIPDIFRTDGEAAFRSYETTALCDMADTSDPLILSTGGGVVTILQNRELLKTYFTTILLNVSIDTILFRLSQDASRPLLETGEDRRRRIEQLMDERRLFYREVADHVVDVDDLGVDDVVRVIETFLD